MKILSALTSSQPPPCRRREGASGVSSEHGYRRSATPLAAADVPADSLRPVALTAAVGGGDNAPPGTTTRSRRPQPSCEATRPGANSLLRVLAAAPSARERHPHPPPQPARRTAPDAHPAPVPPPAADRQPGRAPHTRGFPVRRLRLRFRLWLGVWLRLLRLRSRRRGKRRPRAHDAALLVGLPVGIGVAGRVRGQPRCRSLPRRRARWCEIPAQAVDVLVRSARAARVDEAEP